MPTDMMMETTMSKIKEELIGYDYDNDDYVYQVIDNFFNSDEEDPAAVHEADEAEANVVKVHGRKTWQERP